MGKFTDLLSRVTRSKDDSPDGSVAPDAPDPQEARPSVRSNRSKSKQLEQQAREADLQRDLDALYTPENWKAIASLYFDARYVSTGDDEFQLTPAEQTTLGTSLAATARLMLKIDPGYVAAIIFLGNMGKLIAVKEARYNKKKKMRQSLARPAAPTDSRAA